MKINTENNILFLTASLNNAAVLKTFGLPLLHIVSTSKDRYIFLFDDKHDLAEELIHDFRNRDLRLVSWDLLDNVHDLITHIYHENNS